VEETLRSRPVPLAVLSVVLAAGTAACGSSGSSVSSDGLAGLTAPQVVTRALADGEAAPRVHLTGTASINGTTVTQVLTVVGRQGCAGTEGVPGKGSIRLVIIGDTAWVKPDSEFWQYYQSIGGSPSAGVALAGKYLKLPASDLERDGFAGPNGPCTVSNMFRVLTLVGVTTVATTKASSQPTVEIAVDADGSSTGYTYVSDTADPELVRIETSAGGDSADDTFTYPATPAAIVPPPPQARLSTTAASSRTKTPPLKPGQGRARS
jgi:hypothetical protein